MMNATGTVDLDALQAEHDAMEQEIRALRESSHKREADVKASIAQLQEERARLERRLRRQSQTVEELSQARQQGQGPGQQGTA
jgi:predicted  nucleic acid-binding Zn-ribbon protein